MALDGTYEGLQASVLAEIDIDETELTASVPDLIRRGEVKINRTLRIIQMEQLSYAEWSMTNPDTSTRTDKRWPLPEGMLEMLDLRVKVASADDTDYTAVKYIAPSRIHDYYKAARAPEPTGYWRITLTSTCTRPWPRSRCSSETRRSWQDGRHFSSRPSTS